jgi:hypothetical protein
MLRNSCPTIVALVDLVHGVPFHKQCLSCRGLVCFVLWHDFVVLLLLSMLLNMMTFTAIVLQLSTRAAADSGSWFLRLS